MLRTTLESMIRMKARSEWHVEIVVVDNASDDETETVVQEAGRPGVDVRYVREGVIGKSVALNRGLSTALGDVILFIDDDVLVDEDWLEQMVGALNQYDVVVGRVDLADHMNRPWLDEYFRGVLASREFEKGELELVGANMGLRQSVLASVDRFDTEIGPGALGACEETLFGFQAQAAGLSIGYEPRARVVHDPGLSRLHRRAWLSLAARNGRSQAYIRHHWFHENRVAPTARWFWLVLKLSVRRRLQPPPPLDEEGCPRWEISYVNSVEFWGQFRIECRRPRKYASQAESRH